jgi:ATP-dependent helicase/nuclease subunit A
MTSAELLAQAAEGAVSRRLLDVDLPPLPAITATQPPAVGPCEEWFSSNAAIRSAASNPSAISASSLEGALQVADDELGPGLEKGLRNLELPPWNKGRYGTAVGRAVHAVLQTVNLVNGVGLNSAVASQSVAEGVLGCEDVIRHLCQQAVLSPIIQAAASRPHWSETYVGTTLDDGTVLEGFIDLVYRDDDGSLVVVDYKTDSVTATSSSARIDTYKPQMATYLHMLGEASGEPVERAVLLFLSPTVAIEHSLRRSELPRTGLSAVGT